MLKLATPRIPILKDHISNTTNINFSTIHLNPQILQLPVNVVSNNLINVTRSKSKYKKDFKDPIEIVELEEEMLHSFSYITYSSIITYS